MSEVKRYTIYESITIYLPTLKGIEYYSDRVRIKDKYMTVFATIENPYRWDGSSPKWMINGRIYGTPDFGDKLKIPTLAHDLLYEIQCTTRKVADLSFLHLMYEANFKYKFAYYRAVRFIGWAYWYIRKIKTLLKHEK
jgi:hypothetical protein